MTGDRPLFLTIQEMAIQAATGDPRFPAVRAKELSEITIEISVLSPLRSISFPMDTRGHGLQRPESRSHRSAPSPRRAYAESIPLDQAPPGLAESWTPKRPIQPPGPRGLRNPDVPRFPRFASFVRQQPQRDPSKKGLPKPSRRGFGQDSRVQLCA